MTDSVEFNCGSHGVCHLVRSGFRCSGVLLALSVAGCAIPGSVVQAPFDSYVCGKSSLEQCAGYARQNWAAESAHYADPADFMIDDADAGKTIKTTDLAYGCSYGTEGYKQRLDVKKEAAAVFYSPIALQGAKDALVRLNRARMACSRVVDNYNYQTALLQVQDTQATGQLVIQYLSARVEADSLANGNVGGENPTPQDITSFGLPATPPNSIRGWLQTYRNSSTQIADQLRRQIRQQSLSADFPHQFSDAQNLIDGALRDFEKQLFVLDLSTVDDSSVRFEYRWYRKAAWVKQGTEVMREISN